MTKILALAALPLVLAGITAQAQEDPAHRKAREAAEAWLAWTDQGQYGKTWEEAASLFRAAVPRDQWETVISGLRSRLGPVQVRKFKSATPARSLPGAPDGEYLVIQYETRFQNKAASVETITPMLDRDGAWRVSGYFIR